MYQRINDYLYNMEALNHRQAKKIWRDAIKNSWDNCCAYCGKPPIDDSSLTLDHVKAKCKGGEDLRTNIVPADKNCNLSKGSSDWKIWFRDQSFYEEWKEFRIHYWLKNDIVLSESTAKQLLSEYRILENLDENYPDLTGLS
jgi:hypothetical protein